MRRFLPMNWDSQKLACALSITSDLDLVSEDISILTCDTPCRLGGGEADLILGIGAAMSLGVFERFAPKPPKQTPQAQNISHRQPRCIQYDAAVNRRYQPRPHFVHLPMALDAPFHGAVPANEVATSSSLPSFHSR